MGRQWGRRNNGWFIRVKKDGTPLESSIQMQVAEWLHYQYPDMLWTASTEGIKLPKMIALMFKLMGYCPGTPDIEIFEPKGIYHGLHLEMKSKDGTQSKEQIKWQAKAEERGYKYAVAWNLDQAIQIINEYMRRKNG